MKKHILKAIAHLENLNYECYISLTETRGFHFIIYEDNEFYKILVKIVKLRKNSFSIDLRTSTYKDKLIKKALYNENDYDLLFCFYDDDKIWLIPRKDVPDKSSLTFRDDYDEYLLKPNVIKKEERIDIVEQQRDVIEKDIEATDSYDEILKTESIEDAKKIEKVFDIDTSDNVLDENIKNLYDKLN